MDLNGTWQATLANDSLRRAFIDPAFDASDWVNVTVPGHWQESPSLAYSDGPVLYRKSFKAKTPKAGERAFLRLDGVFYQSDVWMDEDYLGDTEGYFAPNLFDITSPMRDGEDHIVGVDVACSRPQDLAAKRNLTGIFQHWDSANPNTNPGGIWRPVSIETSGPVFVRKFRVLCAQATTEYARLNVRTVLDASEAMTASIRTSVRREGRKEVVAEHTEVRPLAAGDNRLKWSVHVEQPELWWPHSLGEQPHYEVTIDVTVGDPDKKPSHSRSVLTGIRQVDMDDWIFRINGEPLFLKGTNLGPTAMRLGSVDGTRITDDIAEVKAVGLDLARVHGHINRPELYEAADREGVLLWQDLPLQWGYARSVRKAAAHQAREAVDLLGHHPSIITWCGHSQPSALDISPDTKRLSGRYKLRKAAFEQLPTWNRTVLGTAVRRALSDADSSRPINASAGALPNLVSMGGDTQFFTGWETPDVRDFTKALKRLPRLGRFVSAFGAQAVPLTAEFVDKDRWPHLDFDQLTYIHSYQRDLFELHVPPSDYDTFDEWALATQKYQANVIKHHIEALRVRKYHPAGGFCQYLFADADPGTTCSVLDYERRPKAGYDALVEACRPVIVMADWPAPTYRTNSDLKFNIHVVNDRRKPLHDVEVTARVGDRSWTWGGGVEADSAVRIARLQTVTPSVAGPLTLALELRSDTVEVNNEYELHVTTEGK